MTLAGDGEGKSTVGLSRRFLLRASLPLLFFSTKAGEAVSQSPIVDVCSVSPQRRSELKAPFTAVYRKRGDELRFVGTRHTTDPASETFRAIFESVRSGPDLVIVERPFSRGSASPLLKLSVPGRNLLSESEFARTLSHRARIPWKSGEPPDEVVISQLTAAGYSLEDVLGAFIIRGLNGVRVKQKIDLAELPSVLTDLEVSLRRRIPALRLVPLDFREWHIRKMNVSPESDLVSTERGVPCGRGFSSEVIRHATNIRNTYLGRLVLSSFDKADRVLVVYGAGHYLPLDPLFQQRFGAPVVS